MSESDMARLARDLEQVPREAAPRLRKAIEVTARNVKDGWREKLQGSETIPHGARSISYDIEGGPGALTAEVGPPKPSLQGFYVGLIETGSPRTPPRGYGIAALHENEADFEVGIKRAIDDALDQCGL